ncbi:hypothetical protein F506_17865 [Herbaspirillum hiltneri N3]|uniref:Filamentous haemagglutinin FhaB/tRNA nuclease CdiA-like TPS domain-containing protein n=2 Tax=Herbaspirillum TaxID=963 RepID=A0ABN4I2U4_9BURK|nr:hypothetical protein F506_17865 [Herbaspirillum hiltneri N3]
MGPLQFVWQDAKNSASQLGDSIESQVARHGYSEWQVFAVEVKKSVAAAEHDGNWMPTLSLFESRLPGYLAAMGVRITRGLPSLQFGTPAFAAPIADPAAPIRFQPQVTQSTGVGGGVPVVNITAPNAAGISLNQYSQFNVDAIGLILNNSLISGGSTLGGTVTANGNLRGRTASQIINQVTTQGSASRIAGTIEVFGTQADVIIANPNGINCTACGFINTPRVVMTTGTPQFLSARGGVSSSFDNAKALSYDVRGGHIQIEGLAGVTGTPGAGIEGSAGVIDLIGGSIGVNASINAGQQINLISGQQLVSEAVAGQGKVDSDYSVATNGSSPNFSGPDPTLQIDATAFGAMNAGQIKVVATTAGLGVKAGVLNANNGNVTIDANGNVNATNVYGSQGATIRADGSVSAGTVTSYGAASFNAGTDVTVGQITAANNAQITGRNIAIGNAVVGGALTVNGSGNVTTSQSGAIVGDAQFTAGGGFTNTGNWTAGGNLNISANTVGNALSSQLSGLGSTTVTAGSMVNYGTLYGDNLRVTLSGGLDNTFGSMLAKTAMVANVGSLVSNLGGTMYVGDPNAAANAAPAGDLALTVSSSGSSFNNLGGLIAASNGLTVNAVNAALDMSGTATGRLNAGGALAVNAGLLVNSGSWLASGSSVSLSGVNGIVNAGVVQSAGNLTLSSSAGVITNGGALVAGQDLTLNGTTNNIAGAILHAERDLTINGAGTNAGTMEALRNVSLQGSDFNNSKGIIQANNNFSANLTGTLTNVAGTIAAQKDVSIQAATVNNDRAAPVTAVSTMQQIVDVDFVGNTYLGVYTLSSVNASNAGGAPVPSSIKTDVYISTLFGQTTSVDRTAGTLTISESCDNAFCSQTSTRTYELPKVDQVMVKQTEGAAGQILAGNNLVVTATTLSNRGSTISAGNNLVANLSTLSNGASDSFITYRAGETVNQASLNAFLQAAQIDLTNLTRFANVRSVVEAPSQLTGSVFSQAQSVVALTNVVETSVLGTRGMLRAGANVSLNGSGNLVNAGDLVAGNNINITLPGNFVNQGTYQSSFTTRPGCLPSATCREDNAHVDTFAYQQTSNSVVAGGTLTVTAGTITNNFGTLSARNNVNLSANSLDNLAGTILSTSGDVNIAAASITNRVVSPVTTHVSYGDVNPEFALGCNAGGTYKGSECNIDRENQASAAAIISGARNVNVNGDSLVNTGGLITAGADANINISGSVSNTAVALNTYWQGHWTEETCWFCSDKEHYTNGVIADGTQIAGIQAGNALTVISGGNVLNTGNLFGSDVALSGLSLTNGITDTRQPTAASTVAPQWIPIGPSGDAVSADGTPSTLAPVYAVNVSGGDLLSSFGPSLLVANLPPALRPETNQFYYDASTESNLIRQEAIKQTGSGTFVNGVAWSSTNNLSIDDQQKAVLYNNAITYATENNLQLGKPLSSAQISALDKPMLWYTEQTVPDPSCSFTSTVCGTVSALMPQIYLPQNYAGSTSGGVISGNDVKLTFKDSITNTGIIQATNLDVKTATLTNEQRSVDIGTSAYKVQGGWMEYTGTQLQPGGFMSAVNLNVQADRITSIGDAFRVVNTDGTPNTAGTAALLSSLRQQLGSDFTEITPHDNIQTNFIKDTSGPGAFGQVLIIAMAIALAVVTGGAAAAALGGMQQAASVAMLDAIAAGATFTEAAAVGGIMASAAGGIIVGAVSAAAGAMASNAFTQLATTGSLNIGSVFKAGAVSGLTAGLTQGTLGDTGMNTLSNGVVQGNPQITLANVSSTALKIGEQGLISAGVNTAINGGSFGTAFLNNVVNSTAAVGANAIGDFTPTLTSDLGTVGKEIAYLAAHGLLGCAASAAGGSGCASGAIGGTTSAALTPYIGAAVLGDQTELSNEQLATVTALAMLSGGAVASLLGKDAVAAATAAQNEAMNNWAMHIRLLPGQKSEAEKLAQAQQDCSPTNPGACSDAQALSSVSAQRDAALAKACSSPSSASCAFQKLLATATGNDVQFVNGVATATPAPQPSSSQPNVGAATLDNMLGNPLAGIFGGLAYYFGGSNLDAFYASQLGTATDGLLASISGFNLPKAPRIVGASNAVIPSGFASNEAFTQFGVNMRNGLSAAGYTDAEPILQGSAVTGKSFATGRPFDVGRASDFDVAIASPKLLQAAEDAGIGLRSGGTRTGPLSAADLKSLGLQDLANQMSQQAGRDVNFMIYNSTASATQRAPSIVLPNLSR